MNKRGGGDVRGEFEHTGDGGDVREGRGSKQGKREVGEVGEQHENHRPRGEQQGPFPVSGHTDLRWNPEGRVREKYRLGYQLTPLHTIHSSGRNPQRMKRTKSR